jgi:hypothetical protein
MKAVNLFQMLTQRIVAAYHRYQVEREISWTQRNLEVLARQIADGLEAKRYLQWHLVNLKIQRKSL